MRKPTEYETAVGRYVRSQFGDKTKVIRYGDDTGKEDVFLASGEDVPVEGVTSYGTVGLSKYIQHSGTTPVHVELLGACATDVPVFANVVTSCVFDHIHNGTNIAYGSYIENILDQYAISTTLRHVTFVAPFLWEGFAAREIVDVKIHWLLVLPISNAELVFLESNGVEALENLFEQKQIDIYDINRPSAA